MTAEAERYLRRLAEAELRQAAPGADRIEAAADVLVWAGAIGWETADRVLAGFSTARDLRGRGAARLIRPSPRRPGPGPGTAPLTGAVRVVPIGVTLPGRYQPLHLLALTLAPGQAAVVTVAGLIDPDGRPGRDDLPIGPYGLSGPGWGLTFTGDDGTQYPFTAVGGGTSDGVWWRQDLVLPAAVAAGAGAAGAGGAGRWLEVTADEGPATVRVNLPADGGADDPEAAGEVADADAGWLLDSIAAGQLWLDRWAPDPGSPSAGRGIRLAAQADAVQEVGLVPSGSPARRRYAALAGRLGGTGAAGTGTAGAGAAGAGAGDLPAAWADVLAAPDPGAGQEAAWPGVAVLPPLDGVQFAVTGVVSAASSITVQALAWELAPAAANRLTTELFSWWACDDTGHWHVGRAFGGRRGQPVIALDVVLVPALPPAATALKIIVTGRGGQVRAGVELPGG
jgi:hypothetical protein